METKKCNRCGRDLLVANFNKRKNGLNPWCKECNREYLKIYYIDHKEKIKLYASEQKNNPDFTDYPQEWFYYKIKRGAIDRNIKFDLTYEQFISSHTGICSLSGDRIFYTKHNRQASSNQTASLDRIDSSRGYELGNIQWVHKNINFAKQQLSNVDFIEMCKRVALYSFN